MESFSRKEKKSEGKEKRLIYIQYFGKLLIRHYIILEHGKLFNKSEKKNRRQGEKTYLYSIFWKASHKTLYYIGTWKAFQEKREKKPKDKEKRLIYIQYFGKLLIRHYIILEHGKVFKFYGTL